MSLMDMRAPKTSAHSCTPARVSIRYRTLQQTTHTQWNLVNTNTEVLIKINF